MAKRRPSGDGMVRKRDDGRWEGRIVVGHKENGGSMGAAEALLLPVDLSKSPPPGESGQPWQRLQSHEDSAEECRPASHPVSRWAC